MTSHPVVLVHGSMHGAWCWDDLRRALDARGVRSVAVELPGHGTRVAEGGTASMSAYANTVHDLIAFVGEPVLLVGHSMAGQIVVRVTVERPDTVAHLVLVNAQVLRDGETHESTLPPPVRDRYSTLIRQQGGTSFRLSDDEIHQRWLQDLATGDPRLHRALRLITPQPVAPFRERSMNQQLASTSVPVTYVRSRDDAGPPERMDRFVSRLPDRATVESVPGSHDCMISQPEALADVLARPAAIAESVAE